MWEYIEDAFEFILDGIGSIWEFLSGIFDNLGDFSIGGAIFGLLVFIFIYALRDYMLNPFLVHMSKGTAIFWGGATYICSALGGYLVGKRLFDD